MSRPGGSQLDSSRREPAASLALLGYFVVIPYVTLYGFWITIIAYVVLAVGNVMKI